MTKRRGTRLEVWEELLVSDDLVFDLGALYPPEFQSELTKLFDVQPDSGILKQGIWAAARSFLRGKFDKRVEKSEMLQHSGRHIINAGLAADQLSYALKQISKSPIALDLLNQGVEKHLSDDRSFGKEAHQTAQHYNGASVPLAFLQELSEALAQAADQIIPLPERTDNVTELKRLGQRFVSDFNAGDRPFKLSTNHALEEAARAFKPTWEAFSNTAYIRGRYKHERGGYDSLPARALCLIVSKLDSKVTESLCGTAIENIRKQGSRCAANMD